MSEKLQPHINTWYQTPAGEKFEVVALDETEENVEVQYLDGTLTELDMDVWESMAVEEIETPPEAFSALYTDGEDEDEERRGLSDMDDEDDEWSGSLEDLD